MHAHLYENQITEENLNCDIMAIRRFYGGLQKNLRTYPTTSFLCEGRDREKGVEMEDVGVTK